MSEYVVKIEYSQELVDKVINKALEQLKEQYFLIKVEDKEILDLIRGYFSDGGGEDQLHTALIDSGDEFTLEDVRDDEGTYVGICVRKENE